MENMISSAAPHTRCRSSVTRIMLCVLLALLPAAAAGCITFGLHALKVLAVTTAAAVITEAFFCLITRKKQTVPDLSAAVTGLLLGMTLPPDLPMRFAAAGSFFAIAVVKLLFGGIGKNFVNPALTARIAMLLAFRSYMTAWRVPGTDIITAELPSAAGEAGLWDLFLGHTAGCIGEVCSVGLLLGAAFLCITGIISPVSPLSFLGSFALLTFLGGYSVPHELLTGGLLLGACFMASDYTTTPMTTAGKWIFGIGCGSLTFIIRHFGGYAEATAFAIVIMNLLTPQIDRLTRTLPFGAVPIPKQKRRKKAEQEAPSAA